MRFGSGLNSGLNNPIGIAIDSTKVYWAEDNGNDDGGNTVKKVSINGGTVTTLTNNGVRLALLHY